MYLIKNKINNRIIEIMDNLIDLLAFYHINLKRNYPETDLDDFELIEENDEETIQEIYKSKEVYLVDGIYDFIPSENQHVYQIDKMEQLQCQINSLRYQLEQLKSGS